MTTSLTPVVQSWLDIWNGDLDLIPDAVDPAFRAHAAPLTGGPAGVVDGRDALGTWVSGVHGLLADLRFTIEVGPLAAGAYIAVRWRADGTYHGGLPGSSPDAIGRHVVFYGTDTLRLTDGRIAEYWANADSAWFLQQLGVDRLPSL